MSFQNVSVINVHCYIGLKKALMGRLAMQDRTIFFEYNAEFLKTGIELSPFKLPLKPGAIACNDRLFDGLFGIFNDSLPDGWGKLLLDRKLLNLGLNPGSLSPLDRLRYVGSHGMGALVYEPEIAGEKASFHNDLDEIANESLQFLENDDDKFIDDLLAMNGSSAGARPKIMVNLVDDSFTTDLSTQEHSNDWIIKFRSSVDPKDIGPIEYAYHLMAKAAKLVVPEARIFASKTGHGYYGVKRFDRSGNKRIHMHTMSGIFHIDYRVPSMDYADIMKATWWLTKDNRECEEQFRVAVFNVLTHNRDDHAKNFSFIMNENGAWHVSPAYDLTFSQGPSGEHCTTIMGEGKNPNMSHLLKLAQIGEINAQRAKEIIEEVKSTVLQWKNFATDSGVTTKSMLMIQKAMDHIVSRL